MKNRLNFIVIIYLIIVFNPFNILLQNRLDVEVDAWVKEKLE